MNRRWLTRALTALVVPALLVPTLASSADAASKKPGVPTLGAATRVYPFLQGGDVDVTRLTKVRMPAKSCGQGKVIKGATARDAFYTAKTGKTGPSFTGATPGVEVTLVNLPSAGVASRFLAAGRTEGDGCPADEGQSATIKAIKLPALGDQRWGFQAAVADTGEDGTVHTTFVTIVAVRVGAQVVTALAVALEGDTAPSTAKTIRLARVALLGGR